MPNSRAEEAANRKQKIKDLREINNLHGQLNIQIEKEFKLTERFTTLSTKQLKIYNQIIDAGKDGVKNGKISAEMLKDDIAMMGKLLKSGQSLGDLEKLSNEHAQDHLKLIEAGLDASAGLVMKDKHLVDSKIEQVKTSKMLEGSTEAIASSMGLSTDTMNELVQVAEEYGPAVMKGVIAAELSMKFFSMLGDMITDVSEQIDNIGEEFGAVGLDKFQGDLLLASANAQRLGFGFEDVVTQVKTISEEFGVGFKESLKMVSATLDLQKTLGLSESEAGTLVGYFTQIVGHSTESAVQMLKAAEALAVAEGVAPAVVMEDVAANTEIFAKFGQDGGRNLLTASIQARKLGANLGDVAGIADSLLNFQDSLNKEVEAEIMLGKDLNLQKARELALNNDLEGMMSEITKQVGSQAEFEEMNAFQRQALADAVGVSVGQMQEFIANQDKSVTLAEKLAEQEGFEQMVGEDALSSLAAIQNSFKTIGAVLTQTLAPAIEWVLAPFAALFGWLSKSEAAMGALKGAAMVLIPVLTVLAGKALFAAIGKLWSSAMSMAGITMGFGLPLALAAGAAGVGMIMGSMRSAKNIGDGFFPAGGAPVVSTNEGAFQLSPNDDMLVAPGLGAGGSGKIDALASESRKTNARLDALIKVTEKTHQVFNDGTLAKAVGREAGRATGGELKSMNL